MIRCKACDRARNRVWYEKNFERKLAYSADRKRAQQQAAPRLCQRCGAPATSSRHWFCDECRDAGARRQMRRSRAGKPRKKRPSSYARGYGRAHQQLRARWARLVAAGTVSCARCQEPIAPDEPWDLGHDDQDRRAYNGPEHAFCNRSAAGDKAHALKRRSASRDW